MIKSIKEFEDEQGNKKFRITVSNDSSDFTKDFRIEDKGSDGKSIVEEAKIIFERQKVVEKAYKDLNSKSEKFLKKYVGNFIKSDAIEDKINNSVSGVNVTGINKTRFSKFNELREEGLVEFIICVVGFAAIAVFPIIIFHGNPKPTDNELINYTYTEEAKAQEANQISYDEATKDMDAIAQEFKEGGYDFKKQDLDELYFVTNHDQMTPDTISKLIANGDISNSTASDYIKHSLEVLKPIIRDTKYYITDQSDKEFKVTSLVKNEYDSKLINKGYKLIDIIKNIKGKDKKRLVNIYGAYFEFNRNPGVNLSADSTKPVGSESTEVENINLGNYNDYSSGSLFIFNAVIGQGMVEGIKSSGCIDQRDIDSLTGTSDDIKNFKHVTVLNTRMYDVSTLMKEIKDCTGEALSGTSSGTYDEETNTFTVPKSKH